MNSHKNEGKKCAYIFVMYYMYIYDSLAKFNALI